jgi:hypothetical protein
MKELSKKSLDMAIEFSEIAKMKNVFIGAPLTLSMVRDMYPDADIVINTALFDMSNGKLISRLFMDGKPYGGDADWAKTWGIAFGDEAGPRQSWDNGVGAPEFIGPYSSCIFNGTIGDGLNDKSKRGRTALGLANGKLVIVCTPDGSSDAMTTAQLAQVMKDRGCTFAINLDGGGSSQFYGPENSYSSGRKCPAWLAIWLKKDVQVEPEKNEEYAEPEVTPVEPDKKQEASAVKCVCKKKTYTLDNHGNAEGNRYIAVGDVCYLEGITQNCLIAVSYPTSQGMRKAYIKGLENFGANPTKA